MKTILKLTLLQCHVMFVFVAVSARACEWKFSCPRDEIARYTAYHVSQPIPQ